MAEEPRATKRSGGSHVVEQLDPTANNKPFPRGEVGRGGARRPGVEAQGVVCLFIFALFLFLSWDNGYADQNDQIPSKYNRD